MTGIMLLRALVPAALLLLAGCVSPGTPRAAPSPAGQTLRTEAANGSSLLRLQPDGTVLATFGQRTASGRWAQAGERLCFTWGGGALTECWPYAQAFPRGRTVTVTSDRGNIVRVTRQ